MTLTFGSLFAGIGGFDLGFERAGMKCLWQCEIDDYANRVLEKHWPGVRRHRDVCTFPPEPASDWTVDVICGGFPCQDISLAGAGAGIEGERSGLWREFARIIRVLRPRFVVVENVAALLGRGLGVVLGELAACGYDAEWDCIPASALGANHQRDRLFVVARYVADTQGVGRRDGDSIDQRPGNRRRDALRDGGKVLADSQRDGREQGAEVLCGRKSVAAASCQDVAHASRILEGRGQEQRTIGERDRQGGESEIVHDPLRRRHGTSQEQVFAGRHGLEHSDWWLIEPDVGRVAHGVPKRVDRLKGLGNAVVPQIAEYIGNQLIRILKEGV